MVETHNGGASQPAFGEQVQELSFLHFANMILRNRYLIVVTTLLAGGAAVVWSVSRDRTYTSEAMFVPQVSDGGGGGMAGIAAQLGVALPAGAAGQSPLFYVDLINSEELLGAVLDVPYQVPGAASQNLADLMEVEDAAPARRRAVAIRKLRGAISATPVRESGSVRVAVRTNSPVLSREIGQIILQSVDELNVRSKQQQAAAERRFIEQRLDSARMELLAAEERLQSFLDQNREFRHSGQLAFTHDRLQREVMMRQQLFTSIRQSYEQARIDEVRNVPMIRVMQRPTLPGLPDSRGTVALGAFGVALGLLLSLGTAIVLELARKSREHDARTYAEFTDLRGQLLADLTRPFGSRRPRRLRAPQDTPAD